MSAEYQSFLLCFHPGHTDVYHNGLPLGKIVDDQFLVHSHLMPDGSTRVPVKITQELVDAVEVAVYNIHRHLDPDYTFD